MRLTEGRIQEIDIEATMHLTQLLGVAEDACLEGRGINADRVIDAAGTLRRIVYRLSGLAPR